MNFTDFHTTTMKDKQNQEVIIQGFNALRNEQRSIASKTNELQQDLNEHKIVIETLDGVSGDRKCFRYFISSIIFNTIFCTSCQDGWWGSCGKNCEGGCPSAY